MATVGVGLPDPRAGAAPTSPPPGPFVEVRVVGWPGLGGRLVLDAEGRPAAVVVLTQALSGEAPAASYALPLEEVRRWAGS